MKEKIKNISEKMKERICLSTICNECCLKVKGICMRDCKNQKLFKDYNNVEVEVEL